MAKHAWKVIIRETRRSATVTGDNPFCLWYEKGKTVRAKPESLGVFCFRLKRYAQNFGRDHYTYKLIKVKPLGKGKVPLVISSVRTLHMLLEFNRDDADSSFFDKPPEGTICYPAVRVLE